MSEMETYCPASAPFFGFMGGVLAPIVTNTCSPNYIDFMVSMDETVLPKAGRCGALEVSRGRIGRFLCTMVPVHDGGDYLPKAGEDDDEWWQDIAKELLVDGDSDGPVRKLEIPSDYLGDGPMVEVNFMKMVEVNPCGEMINSFELVDTMYDGDMFTVTLAARNLLDTSPLIEQIDYTAAASFFIMGGSTASGQQWIQKFGFKNDLSPGAIPVHFANDVWGDYLVTKTVGDIAAGGKYCPAQPAPEIDYLGMFWTWVYGIMGGCGQ